MNTEQIDALVWKRDELQKQIKHQKLMVRQKQYKINEIEDHLNHVYDYWRYCQALYYDTYVKGSQYGKRRITNRLATWLRLPHQQNTKGRVC